MFEKYTVVRGALLESLIEEVNKSIKDGWDPQGSVSFDGTFYIQAMTKIIDD